MKNQKKTELKVGITVFIGLLVLLWVFGWAKNVSLSTGKKEITIKFDSVAGLEKGDAIMVSGVRKGYVEDIMIDKNNALVKGTFDPDIDLREDAVFSIMMLDLMGGKKIEINPGISSNGIDYSKIQTGIFSGDIATAMAMLSSVQYDLVDVIKEVKFSLHAINELLSDKEFNTEFRKTFTAFKNVTTKLNTILSENRAGIKSLIESGNELTKITNEMINDNKESISMNLDELNKVINNSDKLLIKMNDFYDEIKNQQNNIGKAIYDEELLNDIKNSIKQVNELTELMLEQIKGEGINVDANVDF